MPHISCVIFWVGTYDVNSRVAELLAQQRNKLQNGSTSMELGRSGLVRTEVREENEEKMSDHKRAESDDEAEAKDDSPLLGAERRRDRSFKH